MIGLRYAALALTSGLLCLALPAMPIAQTAPTSAADAEEQESLAKPYFGTWMYVDHVQGPEGTEPAEIHRYLLVRWDAGRLQVRTVEYYPKVRARGRESDWGGRIVENSWDITRQAFLLLPDGTIDVSINGTSSVQGRFRRSWWARGTITPGEEDGEAVLRYVTTDGYVPSSKGNLWQPWDRTYKLVSRELDPKLSYYRP